MSKEVRRALDVKSSIVRKCQACGNVFRLWANGGIGDWEKCCGYRYSYVTVQMEYIVEKL
jgi:hypothetical protein